MPGQLAAVERERTAAADLPPVEGQIRHDTLGPDPTS
jgi:hypothetical protein